MFCSNCGKEVNKNQKFCTNCGASLNQITNNYKVNKKQMFMTGITVVILALTVFTILYLQKNTKQFNPHVEEEGQSYSSEISTEKDMETGDAVEKYHNLDFNKKEAYQKYKEICDICEKKIQETDENGIYIYSGSGSFELCLRETLQETNMELYKVYQTVENYCSATNEGLADWRNCIHNTFNSYK